jgi:hypothetical protein
VDWRWKQGACRVACCVTWVPVPPPLSTSLPPHSSPLCELLGWRILCVAAITSPQSWYTLIMSIGGDGCLLQHWPYQHTFISKTNMISPVLTQTVIWENTITHSYCYSTLQTLLHAVVIGIKLNDNYKYTLQKHCHKFTVSDFRNLWETVKKKRQAPLCSCDWLLANC